MANRTVKVSLQAQVSGFVAGMRTANKAAGDFSSKLLTSADKNSQHLNQLSGSLGLVGAGMVGFAALAVKSFADFDKAMSHVQAATHASAEDMKLLRDAALEAGQRTKYSATEAAGAIEELSKAGVSTTDVLNGGLNGALDLASAGSLDVAQAAEIAASAMVQFGLSGKDIPHIADLLAAGAGKAQGSVQDMGLAMKYVGPIAAGMGISIEETAGTIALLASNGILGEQAGTSMRGMLSSLTSPSKAASDQMKNLGISVYDTTGNFIGFDGVAAQLQANLGGLSNAQRDAALGVIFGNEQLTAARVLYKGGSAAVDEWTRSVTDQGYATETSALKMDNLAGDLEKLSGSFDNLLIGMGEGASGPLRSLTQSITEAVDGFNEIDPAAKSALLAIIGGGGLAILGVAGVMKLVTSLGEAKVAAQALGITAGKVGTALKFAGAVGAVAAVGTVVDKLGDSMNGIDVDVEKLSKGLEGWAKSGKLVGDTANFMGGPMRDLVGDFTNLDFALGKLGNQNFKDTVDIWAEKIFPFSGAVDDARKQIETLDEALTKMDPKAASEAFTMITERAKLQGTSVSELNGLFPKYNKALKDSKAANEGAAEGVTKTGTAAQVAKPPVDAIAAAIKLMDTRAKGAEQSLSVLNATLGNVDAQSAYEQAIDDATTRLKEFKEEQSKAETRTKGMQNALELQSQAGRDNAATLRELWGRTGDYAAQILKTTGNQKQANAVISAGRGQLVTMATAFLGSKSAAEKYVTETLGIPKNISSKWNTPGLLAAIGNAGTLQGKANSLDGKVVNTYFKTKFTEIHERITSNKVFGSPGKMATGGLVRGPGTGTSDDVPTWLSNGEFVVNAREATRHRELLERINSGFAATGNRLDLGEVKAGRGRPVQTAQNFATPGTAAAREGDVTVNVNARSVDINERNLQSVTHAARLRARVGRPR